MKDIKEIKKVELKEGDVLVLRVKEWLPEGVIERITKTMKGVFPVNKCLILENGVELDVVGEGDLEKIKTAIRDYHYGLDTRQHGGIISEDSMKKIQQILLMPWVSGEEKQRREGERRHAE